MENLHDGSVAIYDALQLIKDGKYVMPAFQRQFVWNMGQIEKLWDSILLNYPIATFLFWRVEDDNVTWDTYFCDFLTRIVFDSRKAADSMNYGLTNIDTKITNTAILDGQQRLTSLYISLLGEAFIRPAYSRRDTGEKTVTKLLIELNKHKISTDEEEYNAMRYDVRFSEKIGKLSPTQFEVKNILQEKFQDDSRRERAIEDTIEYVPADVKDYARDILNTLYRKVFVDKLIRYTEIIGMKHDDALEMFVRFNAGGKELRKHEITMSIIEAYWSSAKTEFGRLLEGSYAGFGTDFIIRSALMLYGDVVKSTINKKVVDTLKDDWTGFKKALNNLEQLLKSMKIDVSRFKNSWNVLLPIIYYIYNNESYTENVKAIRSYLLRAIFFAYFKSGTTGKLQQMRSNMNAFDTEITIEMLDQMGELRVTDGRIEDVVNSEKGSKVAGEVLYYVSLEWLNRSFRYDQDHLHPESRFDSNKPVSVSAEDWRKWRANRNRLPNLHLLEGRSNTSKNAMRLVDFFNDMNQEQRARFLETAMIPANVSLEIEHFEEFYEARKKLLGNKIKYLLS